MSKWSFEKLASLTESIEYGFTASAISNPDGPRFLRITDIQDEHVNWLDVPFCKATEAERNKYGLSDGDIVFARTGATTGKSFLIKSLPIEAVFASYLIRVRCNQKKVLPDYLAYYFRSSGYWRQIDDSLTGTTQPGINGSKLSDLEIPLPSLDEQRRIAEILDQADLLCRLRRHARQQSDTFLQSVFIEMFGNPSQNPNNWPLETLEEYTEFLTSGSRGWAQYYCKQGDLFLRIQNIGKNELFLEDTAFVIAPDSAEAKRTTVQPRDLILSITADLGRTAVIPNDFGKAYINQHLALIRLNGLNPYYVASFMVSDYGRRQFEALDREGVKSGLNFDNVREFKILIPPKPLQNEFERLLVKFRHLQEQAWESDRQAEMNFQALLHQAFSGVLGQKVATA